MKSSMKNQKYEQLRTNMIFFYSRKPHPRKVHFEGPGERVKPRLSQAFTRGARPDSNSRPVM
jgi:hypothetical protein